MKDNFAPAARQKDLVVQELPGELLVYDLTSNRAHCLNATAASIWKLCSGARTLDDIRLSWMEQNKGAVDIDVIRYGVEELGRCDLLETAPTATKLNRRQVIGRLGLASAVALPVIASLVAPNNALAAVSCTCSTPVQCVNQITCPSQTNCNPASVCAPNTNTKETPEPVAPKRDPYM